MIYLKTAGALPMKLELNFWDELIDSDRQIVIRELTLKMTITSIPMRFFDYDFITTYLRGIISTSSDKIVDF